MRLRFPLILAGLITLASTASATDLQVTTSDGVRLHLIEAGPIGARTVLFVPGWTMPAWIFQPQIDALSRTYHVVAMDPRGQGDSDVPETGYDYRRRGLDISDVIRSMWARDGSRPVLLVGWSLGVLDALAYIHQAGDAALAGLVLIDNSVGEEPAPKPAPPMPHRAPRLPRDEQMRRFVAGMFRSSPSPAYLARLTEYALRTPADAAADLLKYGVPRTYWRESLYSVTKPVLYVVRPGFAAQANNLAAHDPLAESVVFDTAGHALFVDEAARFNTLLDSFILRRVWP